MTTIIGYSRPLRFMYEGKTHRQRERMCERGRSEGGMRNGGRQILEVETEWMIKRAEMGEENIEWEIE